MGDHAAKWFIVWIWQGYEAAQQGSTGSCLALGSTSQLRPHLDTILKFVHRFIGACQPLIVHDAGHNDVPIQIPEIELLFINS